MPTAINDKGELVVLGQSGQWEPAKRARDDKGAELYLDGAEWKSVPKPERTTAQKIGRGAGLPAAGFAEEAIVQPIGGLADLVATGLRATGLPAVESPTFYRDKVRQVYKAAGDVLAAPFRAVPGVKEWEGGAGDVTRPEGTGEELLYGAGRGAGAAASMLVPAAAVANTARAGSVTQNVARQLMTQPGMQVASGMAGGAVGEATDNPWLGLAAAMAVPVAASGARRLVTPVRNQLNTEQQRLAALLQSEGVKLTPGEMTGSTPLKGLESVLERMPFSSAPQRTLQDAKQTAFNAAVLKRAGIDAAEASPDILAQRRTELGNVFKRIAGNRTVPLGQPVDDALIAIDDAQTELRGLVDTARIDKLINGGLDLLAKGSISGKAAQTLRSEITKEAADAAKVQGGARLADALRTFRNAIDDSVRAALPADDAKAWDLARRQYANLKIIERAMTGAGGASGNISAPQLSTAVKASNKPNYAVGQGDLNDLSRAGDQFMRPSIPNSGTPERAWWTAMMGGGAGLAAAGQPIAAGVGLATPPLVQALINSAAGRRWLTNQAMAGRGPMNSALLGKLLLAQGRTPAINAATGAQP